MKNSGLKQAMHYQLNYFAWSFLYVYGIAVAIIITIGLLITNLNAENASITGLGGVGFFHFLVVGISGIRSDLRFFIQHGISRRTTFFSHLYGSLICSTALGLFCVIFNLVSHHWLGFTSYENLFNIQSFFTSWMTYMFAFFCSWQIGVLISLIYYRLSKMQQVVFSVTAIAIVVFGFISGIRFLSGVGEVFLENLLEFSPVGLLLGIIAVAGNYLLLRRVQIK